jgi:hypothetical protein
VKEIGPPPVDRGRIAIFWVLEVLAAMFVIFLVPLVFVLVLGPISWKFEPGPGATSVPNGVVVTERGSARYIQCPSLKDWATGHPAGHPFCLSDE